MKLFGKKNEQHQPASSSYSSGGAGAPPGAFSNALNPGAVPPPSTTSTAPYVPSSAAHATYVPSSAFATAPYVPSAPPGPGPSSIMTSGGTPPKKYVKVNGVMKLNPEYKAWQEAQTGVASTQTATALPIVSNMEDHAMLNENLQQDVPLAESTNATIEMMQEPEISIQAGMAPDDMVDKLGAILSKYEVPMGLMNKLLMLSEFEVLDFIIDDSGSMQCTSDTVDPVTRQPQTRWKEAQNRLKEMMEILAYLPFNKVEVEFLNRPTKVVLTRNGRDPQTFLADANNQIDQAFSSGPAGTTPALEKFQNSLIAGQGKSIARYFFGDGVPNGGVAAQQEIVRILKNRQNPAGNPITFISCTNEDNQVEWMKDAEEIVPYCSESDDYADEAAEVLRDQGAALPYTKGFHLICQLVAAMNPDDLDAMDESVPFTKTTLDNLLGVQHNEESYRHYFDHFVKAQRERRVEGPTDQIKKNQQWNYQDFLRAPVAGSIPQVQQLRQQLKSMQ